jgi:hypothetical protein
MILSLLRFRIGDAEHIKALEKTWAVYRQQHRLDLYGKSGERAAGRSARCVHP